MQFVKPKSTAISQWFISPLPDFVPLVESGEAGWEEMTAHTARPLDLVARQGLCVIGRPAAPEVVTDAWHVYGSMQGHRGLPPVFQKLPNSLNTYWSPH